jgi:hypothetical protein
LIKSIEMKMGTYKDSNELDDLSDEEGEDEF